MKAYRISLFSHGEYQNSYESKAKTAANALKNAIKWAIGEYESGTQVTAENIYDPLDKATGTI